MSYAYKSPKKDGTYIWPCSSHDVFAYMTLNKKMRDDVFQSARMYVEHSTNYEHMTNAEIKKEFNKDKGRSLMKKITYYTKKTCGSSAYWWHAGKKLEAIIKEYGAATSFATFSSSDLHWKDLYKLLKGSDEIPTSAERYKLWYNPQIVGDYFKQRWRIFFKCLKKVMGIKHFWWRYEFQSRGSFHVHALFWLDNDPGLCELTAIAKKGHRKPEKRLE